MDWNIIQVKVDPSYVASMVKGFLNLKQAMVFRMFGFLESEKEKGNG